MFTDFLEAQSGTERNHVFWGLPSCNGTLEKETRRTRLDKGGEMKTESLGKAILKNQPAFIGNNG